MAAAVVLTLGATPASAADSGPTPGRVPDPRPTPIGRTCTGLLLDSIPVTFAGETVGRLNVFYSQGFNCATVAVRRKSLATASAAASAPASATASPPPVPAAGTAVPTTPTPTPAAPAVGSMPPFTVYVALQRCEAVTPSAVCRDVETQQDSGTETELPGPVRVYAPQQCIRAEGRIVIAPGQEAYAETRPGATFCG